MNNISSLFTIYCCLSSVCADAQNFHPEYEDDYLGWIKIYNYKGAARHVQIDEKKYSIAQLSIIDSFANWMQASYTPRGGLGDIRKYLTPKKNLYGERYNEAVPPSYGANAVTYGFLKKVNGKWTPENNLGFYWTIAANEIPLDNRLEAINTSKVCLFTIPSYDERLINEQPNGDHAKEKRLLDLSGYPAISKYIFYTKPTLNGQEQARNVVILSKGNRLPFVRVTIGEMLQYMADALPEKYAEEKITAQEQNSYDAKHLALAMKSLDTKYDKAYAMLTRLKEQYKGRLAEFAYGYNYSVLKLANGEDVFTINGDGRTIDKASPVFKVDPALGALCKTDKPQWIMIKWFGRSLEDPSFKHLHESIIHNFDFDYVYNFFFDTGKASGGRYRPRRSPIFEDHVKVDQKSPDALKAAADPAVIYFEDFSSTVAGQKPNGWKSELNAEAKTAIVVNVKDRKEKWLEIKGHYFVFPQNLKKPLPRDFEISFDLAVPQDIPWGTKALEFYMGTKTSYDENAPSLQLRIRAGFSGRAGEAVISGKFGDGYFNTYRNFEAAGFSNEKAFNTVRICFRKTGESFEYLIDTNSIMKLSNAIPAKTLFNWVQFKHLNSDGDSQKYFVSNFRVVAL
jgi:hypothetical protein